MIDPKIHLFNPRGTKHQTDQQTNEISTFSPQQEQQQQQQEEEEQQQDEFKQV